MNNKNPLFSIISINFNDVVGIKRTIESVLNQDFHDFEHIIIDGASTDGSVDVIRTYQNQYDTGQLKWVSEKDNGIYHAMNKGLKMARGQFVNMLNGGDWYCGNALSIIAQHIETMPDISVFGAIEKLWEARDAQLIPVQVVQMYPALLNCRVMYHQALFFARSLHDRYGLYREDLSLASDQAFIMEIFVKNKTSFYLIENVLVNFLRGGRGDRGGIELMQLYDEYFPKKTTLSLWCKNFIKNFLPYGFVIWFWTKYKKERPE
ncbi:MAG: glycosyltransferase family 2 protein [Spirochaetia bacterium]